MASDGGSSTGRSVRSRRIIIPRYGDERVLSVEDHPRSEPGPGEIAIEVAFAGVNHADVVARRGFYKWAPPPPMCLGFEVSGTVRAVGAGDVPFAVGDRVMAVTKFGGYADDVVVDAARVHAVPSGMSLEEAAALPAVYLTAWHALHEVARVRAGESVLIHAVAGGVGTAALQLAKHAGLLTFGTASSQEKLAHAGTMGLDHGIDYTKEDFEERVRSLSGGRGVDVVLDSLGGESLKKGYRLLARGGRVVSFGAAQVVPTRRGLLGLFSLLGAAWALLRGGVFHPFQLLEDNRGVFGVQILLYWDDLAHMQRGMRAILELYEEGVARPVIDSIVPLAEVQSAHRRLESRQSKGKLLLECRGGAG